MCPEGIWQKFPDCLGVRNLPERTREKTWTHYSQSKRIKKGLALVKSEADAKGPNYPADPGGVLSKEVGLEGRCYGRSLYQGGGKVGKGVCPGRRGGERIGSEREKARTKGDLSGKNLNGEKKKFPAAKNGGGEVLKKAVLAKGEGPKEKNDQRGRTEGQGEIYRL